jgi:hypothetical protein
MSMFQELDDTMNEIKKRANHVRTNLKTMELAIEEQEKLDKSRFTDTHRYLFFKDHSYVRRPLHKQSHP